MHDQLAGTRCSPMPDLPTSPSDTVLALPPLIPFTTAGS